MDGLLAWLLIKSNKEIPGWNLTAVMISFAIWLVSTKAVKLVPHFHRYPMDVRFIPLAVVFGYLHGVIKIYALLTLDVVSCGR